MLKLNGKGPNSRTYWNGEPCQAVRVRVIVGTVPFPTWWCKRFEGKDREAVLVTYHGKKFFLDNEDGQGWLKVTKGKGGPGWMHASLPDDSKIIRHEERDDMFDVLDSSMSIKRGTHFDF